MKKHDFLKSKLLRSMVLASIVAVLVTYLMFTNPQETNVGLTFLPLIFLWLSAFIAATFINLLLKSISPGMLYTFSATLATTITFLVMFSALGSVGKFDVLLLIALASTMVFYVRRTWSK